MKSIDFDPVARYYDGHVRFAGDVPFWVEEVARRRGDWLELMCGTGRLSLPILRSGSPLTCVDYSAGLLAVLARAVERERLPARLFEMDVRTLVLPDAYDWAFIGFNSLSELVTDGDALAALHAIRGVLRPGGALVCTLHNPVVRRPALDGRWVHYGAGAVAGSENRVAVRGRYQTRPGSDLVDGVQIYRETTAEGEVVAEVELPVLFRLLGRADFENLARHAGFVPELLYGAYDRRRFDERDSPVMIHELRVA